ncbi:HPP family protein [Thiomicrorhabdus indica]|uniref:CBS domain-containing protein n=1 Tax=Thiomicrorhabdus indica TaxID=2267253 RepID=UPI00102D90AF|nr:CBS domain-containing protein [Thiomicrorhabdus indica]
MFVVYSPEGQSFAANIQQLPLIRVDPATRINQVTDSQLKELDVDSHLPNQAQTQKKLTAYQKNQAESKRRIAVKVAEVMSHPVITIELNSLLMQVYDRMERLQIDYLPVVDDGVLIGMVNRIQLLKRLIIDEQGSIEQGANQSLAKIMQRQVVTTSMDTEIRQVAQVFSEFDVGAIVVTDEERLVGIVTQGDLVKRLAKEPPVEIYV